MIDGTQPRLVKNNGVPYVKVRRTKEFEDMEIGDTERS
jgi:hypothetical protein